MWGLGIASPHPPWGQGEPGGASQWGRHGGRTAVLGTPTLGALLEGHLARLRAEHPQGDPAASPTTPKGNTNPGGTDPAST